MGRKIKAIIELLYRSLLEIIYPKDSKCIICNEDDHELLCLDCKNKIKKCTEQELCIGYYKGVLRELIIKFKCKKDYSAGEALVELIEYKLNDIDKNYYLTYIPISDKSLKVRGFNQCEYIAKELAYRNNFIVINTLKRVKEVKQQKTLSKEERYSNLNGAFAVINNKLVKDRNFILIDDVITTGATLKEGIKVLRKQGAKDIKILTLAKSYI
jgi:competence protein ComFC